MHFVAGHGNVADNPGDEDAHILFRNVAFFDGETKRVAQIVRWGRSKDSLVLSGLGVDGRITEFYVKWVPIFNRYEAV